MHPRESLDFIFLLGLAAGYIGEMLAKKSWKLHQNNIFCADPAETIDHVFDILFQEPFR